MKKYIWKVFPILILATMVIGACAPKSTPTPEPTPTIIPQTATPIPMVPAGDSVHTVMVGDLERSYLLHIPANLKVSTSAPAVFMFHGAKSYVTDFLPFGFKELADEKGFIIVRPNGTTHHSDSPYALSWNAGTCCFDPVENNIDESAFIREILSDLESIVSMDPKRIYAHGYSNGGMLVYRLACEMSETFAAIAPYAGALVYSPCQPQQPVSILHIHGLVDRAVPFQGGSRLAGMPEEFPLGMEGIETWAQFNGCTETSQIETGNDGISHTAYTACDAASSIELILIQDQGHYYPGLSVISMSEVIWNFFEAHPKQ